ncbi:MAG TPA: BamA/TamA family outer membrane protein [Puia sp.]|jgi:outer membrane protein assembly factor BamA|nr:BamA/TamA family outer membrane protein [Puia sp.]
MAQNPTGTLVPPDKLVEDTTGQRDIIGIALKLSHIHIKKPPKVQGRHVYYSIIPLGSSIPGGGEALITATNAAFELGNPKSTFLSNVTFSPSTNLRGEWNLPFRSNVWSDGNRWNYGGDYRLTFYPQFTWGLGGHTAPSNKILVRYTYVRFYQNALKRIGRRPFLFAGLGYNLDYHINIHPSIDTIDMAKFTGYRYGTGNHTNSFSSGLTLNLLYDSRNNALNPLPGWYYNIVARVNPKFMGSQNNWYSMYVDARKYISFDPNSWNVLAFWSYLWTTFGSNSPYLDLPAITWDANQRSGRGFYPSRYTGRTLWDFEAEYRRSLTADQLLGFVVFTNMNSVTEPRTNNFAYLHAAAGAGLRIKFNKHSGTNFGMDFAASKGYWALYFSLGEAF